MRRGKASRRQLEFDVVKRAVKTNKARFIARLQRHIRPDGGCLIWGGRKDRTNGGYGVINLRTADGKHVPVRAHVLFLILKVGRPIPVGYEAGHQPGCTSPACVRHVELQTYQQNLAQRDKKEPACPF